MEHLRCFFSFTLQPFYCHSVWVLRQQALTWPSSCFQVPSLASAAANPLTWIHQSYRLGPYMQNRSVRLSCVLVCVAFRPSLVSQRAARSAGGCQSAFQFFK